MLGRAAQNARRMFVRRMQLAATGWFQAFLPHGPAALINLEPDERG